MPAEDAPKDLAAWVETILPEVFADDLHEPPLGDRRWLSFRDLLEADAQILRSFHRQLVSDGATRQAAAHYLAGWYAGLLARAVGFGLATTGAAIIFEPDSVLFEVTEEGWPTRLVTSRVSAIVASGHAWASSTDARVVADDTSVVVAVLESLIETLDPFVRSCHRLGRGPLAKLWDEVADGFASAVAHQQQRPVDEAMLGRLRAVLTQDAVPWTGTPRLGWSSSEAYGPVHVAQRGGCCLAFTEPGRDGSELDGADPDPETAEEVADASHPDWFAAAIIRYRERFPDRPGAKRYCSTCCFRTPDDVDARQVFWADVRAQRSLAAYG